MQLDGEDCETEQGFGPPPGAVVRMLKISNQKGLHARASAKFVQTVEKFDVEVRVSLGTDTVDGASILGLMMLAAGPGTELTVAACGRQKAEALAALENLVNDRFGEND